RPRRTIPDCRRMGAHRSHTGEGLAMSQGGIPGILRGGAWDGRADGERKLVEGLLRGDKAAHDALVERHALPAYRVAMRITGSAEDAEAVVRDALSGVVLDAETFC